MHELQHRDPETGGNVYFTLRKPDGDAPYWNAHSNAWEALTIANWSQYATLCWEIPEGGYLYLGTLPAIAGEMTQGWYWLDVFAQADLDPAISDERLAGYFGYWDGQQFAYWASQALLAQAIIFQIQNGLATAAQQLTAAGVWSHPSRTLTQSGQVPAEETSSTLITRRRGDTWEITLTGLGSLVDCEELWCTVKRSTTNPDTAAVVQITKSGGLVSGTSAHGSLSVIDEDAGNLNIKVEAEATAAIGPKIYDFDVQVRRASGQVQTLAITQLEVLADVTRSV